MEHGLNPGIYKIISHLDGSVLTVTTEGNPRAVKTLEFQDLDTQKWKVRQRKLEDGSTIQIIRNETVKNNEVSKAEKEGELGPVDWEFTPSSPDNGNLFHLRNSVGFLTNKGTGERVSFEEKNDSEPASQEWEFEFLCEIEKQ